MPSSLPGRGLGGHGGRWGWGSSSSWSSRRAALSQLQRNTLGAGFRRTALLSSLAAAVASPAVPGSGGGGHSEGQSQLEALRTRAASWRFLRDDKRRVTDIMLLLNCGCFALQWLSKDMLTLWGAKVNILILAGQWWRLLTANFLHSSLLHLAINCHALNIIGPHLEMVAGGKRTAAVYLCSGVIGSVASYVMTPSPSVGASGALFGLGAALALFYWRHKHLLKGYSETVLRSLGITLAINFGYSLLVRNIDNWGHRGGMLGGAAVSALFGPRYVRVETPMGSYILDRPPVPIMAFPDRLVRGAEAKGRGKDNALKGDSEANMSRQEKKRRKRERREEEKKRKEEEGGKS